MTAAAGKNMSSWPPYVPIIICGFGYRIRMALVSLRCPRCGGDIELDDSREFGFCQYCGNRIMIQREVNQVIVQNGSDSQTKRLSKLIEEHLSLGRAGDAEKLVEELRRLDPTYPEIPLYILKSRMIRDVDTCGRTTAETRALSRDLLDIYRTYSGKELTFDEVASQMGFGIRSFSGQAMAYIESGDYEKACGILDSYRTEGYLPGEISVMLGGEEGIRDYLRCLDVLVDAVLRERRYYPKYLQDLLKRSVVWNHMPDGYDQTMSAYMISHLKGIGWTREDFDSLIGGTLRRRLEERRSISPVVLRLSGCYVGFYPIFKEAVGVSGPFNDREHEEIDTMLTRSMFDHCVLRRCEKTGRMVGKEEAREEILGYTREPGETSDPSRNQKGRFGGRRNRSVFSNPFERKLGDYLERYDPGRVSVKDYSELMECAIEFHY